MAFPTFKLLEKYEPIKNLLEQKSFSIRYYIPEKDTNVLIIAERFKDINNFIGQEYYLFDDFTKMMMGMKYQNDSYFINYRFFDNT